MILQHWDALVHASVSMCICVCALIESVVT